MNKYLDIDYLKSIDNKPYYFGLGFIQLKINKSQRIHFWHPELIKTADDEEIHDHRYDFNSTILKGKLKNEIFTYNDNEYGNYSLKSVSCTKDSEENPKFIKNVDIKLVTSYEVLEGQEYFLNKDSFHKTYTDGCVSFLERGDITKEYANVISYKDKNLICPFSVEYSEDYIWKLISELI